MPTMPDSHATVDASHSSHTTDRRTRTSAIDVDAPVEAAPSRDTAIRPPRIVRALHWSACMVFAAISIAIYLAAAPFGYAAFALVQQLPHDPQRRAKGLHTVLHRAFGLMHGWLTMLRLVRLSAPTDAKDTLPPGPCVVVANHPTLVDVTAIIAVFGGMCTVVKPRLYRAWWLRSLMRGAQHIEGSNTPVDAAKIVQAAVSRLEHGHRVLIFPEGTRSPEGGISAFGRTAFEIACRANVALCPVWVRCDPPFLTKTTPVHRLPYPPAVLYVTPMAVHHPADYGHDSRAMQRAVTQIYRARLEGEQKPG